MVEIEMLKTQHFILYKFYTMEIRILYYGNVFWFALEGFFFQYFQPRFVGTQNYVSVDKYLCCEKYLVFSELD